MSLYLRVYVGDFALLLHYQRVHEVGDWLDSGRIPREAAWREQTLPVLALAERLGIEAPVDVYVVVESDGERIMLLVERIDSLVEVADDDFQPVMDASLLAADLLDSACYRPKDDCIYWRLLPEALHADASAP